MSALPSSLLDLLEPSPSDDTIITPNYRAGGIGDWVLERQKVTAPIIRGYFAGLQPFRENWRLMRKGTVWMSITPMERESMMLHVKAAHGNVVIAGLGMGLLVANVARKREVKSVVVIEKDPEVAKLFFNILPRYEGMNKVTVLPGLDATKLGNWQTPVDLLAADIWPLLGDQNAVRDTLAIQKRVNASSVCWWGMELDFVSWCRDNTGKTADEIDLDDYRRFAKEIGLPLIEQNNHAYPRMAVAAVFNSLMS
jgi:hypothetical protein